MKTSKLLKLITIPSVATIVTVAPLSLCQCNKGSDPVDPTEPTVPSSVKEKVNITTTTDKEGNKVSTLSTKKTTDTITGITVSIGSKLLTRDTDYKVEGLSTNSSSVNVTIFKATLDKYSGTITITPTIQSEQAKLNSIKATCSKSFGVNQYIKSSDITVIGTYTDSSTKTLTWNASSNGYTIQDPNGNVIDNFSTTGYKFTTTGSKTFKVLSKDNTSLTSSFTVSVVNTITVTFAAENGTVTPTTMYVEEGKTWADIKNKVSAKADYGYDQSSLIWKTGGSVISDTTPLTDGMRISAKFIERETTEFTNPKICESLNTQVSPGYNSYIPTENVNASGSYGVKGVSYTNDSRYTFKIVLDDNAISNVYYFYIVQLYSSTYKLVNLQKISKSIVSIQHVTKEGTTSINYSLTALNRGTYITFDNEYSTGTILVTIEFHEDNYLPLSLIPIFDANK